MNGVATMRSGWLKLWYKLDDNPIASDAILLGVFTKLLLLASRQESILPDGTAIQRGQLVISQRSFADGLKLGRQQVRRALETLEKLGIIERSSSGGDNSEITPRQLGDNSQKSTHTPTHRPTIVSICRYSLYQDRYSEPNPQTNQEPTQSQPRANPEPTLLEDSKNKEVRIKNKNPPKSPQGELPGIPAELNVPEFLQAWDDWRKHRTEIRKPLKPTSAKRQLAMLSQMGVARAVATIEYTILKGWEGLVDPDRNGSSRHTKKPTPLLPLDSNEM